MCIRDRTDLGIGVCLLNDANAAALGEMWKGAAQGNVNLLFVTLGTGVGAKHAKEAGGSQ